MENYAFLCLPFHGKSQKEIRKDLQVCEKWFRQVITDEDMQFINNNIAYPRFNQTDNNFRLMCVSIGLLIKMRKADNICFGPGWEKSKGCMLEAFAAALYGKHIYAITSIDDTVHIVTGEAAYMSIMDALIDYFRKGGKPIEERTKNHVRDHQ